MQWTRLSRGMGAVSAQVVYPYQTPDIWKPDISKYPYISKNIVLTHFLFLFQLLSQTTDISK